jgi:hypothetical protein
MGEADAFWRSDVRDERTSDNTLLILRLDQCKASPPLIRNRGGASEYNSKGTLCA